MKVSQAIYLATFFLIFSWPVIIQLHGWVWFLWLYPLVIWFGLILYAIVSNPDV